MNQCHCKYRASQYVLDQCTVEPVLKDHRISNKNVVCQDRWSLVRGSVILKCKSSCQKYVVCQDRWSLVRGSVILKCKSSCQKYVVCQDRWSLMTVVSQDRFHWIQACATLSCINVVCQLQGYFSAKLAL